MTPAITNRKGEVVRSTSTAKVTRSSDTEPGLIISTTHRPVRIVDEVRDAQRTDGWRFWILALGFLALLAAASGAVGMLLDWAMTDAVEMAR